ncbi:MAG: NAAT family transporter [Elusimicrobia bacterium]|nr:NAAT family transporter [Elusimicrobiota bacterium]
MPLLTVIFTLLLVMDPLGNIPVFLSVLKDVPPHRRTRLIARELFIALGVLLFFLLCGRFMLSLLDIKQTSMSVAGGIVLFIISMHMIFPPAEKDGFSANPGGEPFIVPLAIPLVAGPSAMSIVVIMATREPERLPWLVLAVCTAWAINALVLLSSNSISKLLGKRGLIAMERLMGMILVTLAVQMLMEGVKTLLVK